MEKHVPNVCVIVYNKYSRGILDTALWCNNEVRLSLFSVDRAAAARCRHKRKVWINNLEGKADGLQSSNQTLQV